MNRINFLTPFLVYCCLQLSFTSQAQNTWIGGFPGRATDWNMAANWSKHQVPDEWDEVYIPNTATTTFAYPVITTDVGMIKSIIMSADAHITISPNGRLGIDNEADSNANIIIQPQIFSNQIVDATALK